MTTTHECYPPIASGDAYPHLGGCVGCREERRCNCCGVAVNATTRCTNGRCSGCHQQACTTGGDTHPGHGFGKFEDQVKACDRQQNAYGLKKAQS